MNQRFGGHNDVGDSGGGEDGGEDEDKDEEKFKRGAWGFARVDCSGCRLGAVDLRAGGKCARHERANALAEQDSVKVPVLDTFEDAFPDANVSAFEDTVHSPFLCSISCAVDVSLDDTL